MSYDIEITGTTYSYRDLDGEPLDGDRIELASHTTIMTMDDDDAFLYEFDEHPAHIMWAVDSIDTTTDAVHPSSSPIGDQVPAHAWLSGSYTDPYVGDAKITETSVRLTGDWTDEERAIVFKAITGKYHTA
jgi:hypothetical protein